MTPPAPGPSRRNPGLTFAAALTAGVALLLLFSPPWHVFSLWSRVPEMVRFVEFRRAAVLLQQVEHPFAPIADAMHGILQWRLLVPLTAHALHLPASVVLALPFVGAFFTLGFIFAVARQAGVTPLAAWSGTLVLGATGWFFTATGWLGYFDSWLALGILATSHARRPWVVWLACFLSPWIDERFVIALPVALGVRWLRATATDANSDPDRSAASGPFRTVAIATAIAGVYVVARTLLAGSGGSPSIAGYLQGQQTLTTGLSQHLFGLWESLRFAWIPVAIGLVSVLRPASVRWRVVFGVAVVMTATVSLLIANDLSRSMTLLLPLALEGLIALRHFPVFSASAWAPGAVAAVCLATPAHLVVTDFVYPVPRASQVYQSWRKPEGFFAASTWVDQANGYILKSDFVQAARALELAARLDPKNAAVPNARGLVAFRTGDVPQALEYFTAACRMEGNEVSFHINRAHAARQLRLNAVLVEALAAARRLGGGDPKHAAEIAELEKSIAR